MTCSLIRHPGNSPPIWGGANSKATLISTTSTKYCFSLVSLGKHMSLDIEEASDSMH